MGATRQAHIESARTVVAARLAPPSMSPRSRPVLSDRQTAAASSVKTYADLGQGFSHGGVPRYYRDALQGLRRAVQAWQEQNVDFAMHLGDIIDGYGEVCSCSS